MLIVSSREFRQKQKSYLDQVDEGMEVLIQRGKNKSYRVIPVSEEDTVIGKEYILRPDADLARAITGEQLLEGAKEDLKDIFNAGRK